MLKIPWLNAFNYLNTMITHWIRQSHTDIKNELMFHGIFQRYRIECKYFNLVFNIHVLPCKFYFLTNLCHSNDYRQLSQSRCWNEIWLCFDKLLWKLKSGFSSVFLFSIDWNPIQHRYSWCWMAPSLIVLYQLCVGRFCLLKSRIHPVTKIWNKFVIEEL